MVSGCADATARQESAALKVRVDALEEQIKSIIEKRHRIAPSQTDAFQIRNMQDIQSALSESSKTMGWLLASIAAISLLVGGIGIMNIMLVSVTERTREIGIRKAIGAPKRAIMFQFLVEATILSLVGGIIGVIGGFIGSHFKIVGVQPVIIPASVFLAFGVSVLIGLFFGGYPASRAASLRPIEALRYE